ncbi:GTP cyclohydrolase II [Candidatus Micrarchaeota archaeon]|nr:GTP cyclohydrolase II [Candidatus Micrarchaeota archaeon]
MTELIAESFLPTKFGEFKILAFKCADGEHIALVKGEIGDRVNVRVHSKCLTGDTFCSMRCDCHEQLEASLKYISENGGVLIYLDQEGRGIGLANKIKAYALQDTGYDTVEANKKLGFENDHRDFKIAAEILHYLEIKKIRLLTNNPEKMKGLEDNGITVERIPLIIKPNKHNKKYLETKAKKMNHMIE